MSSGMPIMSSSASLQGNQNESSVNAQRVYVAGNEKKSSIPRRLCGLLWITAAAVAAVAGAAMSAAGGALIFKAFLAKGTLVGVPVGVLMGALGIAMLFTGLKFGLRIAESLATKGWKDLTNHQVAPLQIQIVQQQRV